jgi:hypothetical protein
MPDFFSVPKLAANQSGDGLKTSGEIVSMAAGVLDVFMHAENCGLKRGYY